VDWPNQLNQTGYKSGVGCEIRAGTYAVGLISWAASEGLTMSLLICDRWLTRKLVTFLGSTDSWSARFSWHDVRGCSCGAGPIANLRGGGWGLALALLGWTCSEPLRRGLVGRRCSAGWAHVTLRSTSALLRPEIQSRPQVFNQYPSPSPVTPEQCENL